MRVPKKRGPKKKQLTPERVVRLKQRRARANDRERSRMHGLNGALEQLRRHIPCFTNATRLSKIETLRLARNYIGALSDVLAAGVPPDALAFGRALVDGLSHNSINLVANFLHVSPHLLALPAMSIAPAATGFNTSDAAFGDLLCAQRAGTAASMSTCWPYQAGGGQQYHQSYQQACAPDSTSSAPAQSSSTAYECSAADTLRQMALLVELGPKRVAGPNGGGGGSSQTLHSGIVSQTGGGQVLPSYAQSPTTPSNNHFKTGSGLLPPGPLPVQQSVVYNQAIFAQAPVEHMSSPPLSWPPAIGGLQPSALVTTPGRTLGSPPGPVAQPPPPPYQGYPRQVPDPTQHMFYEYPRAQTQTAVLAGAGGAGVGAPSIPACYHSVPVTGPVSGPVGACEQSAFPSSAYSLLDQLPLPTQSHAFAAHRIPVR